MLFCGNKLEPNCYLVRRTYLFEKRDIFSLVVRFSRLGVDALCLGFVINIPVTRNPFGTIISKGPGPGNCLTATEILAP